MKGELLRSGTIVDAMRRESSRRPYAKLSKDCSETTAAVVKSADTLELPSGI